MQLSDFENTKRHAVRLFRAAYDNLAAARDYLGDLAAGPGDDSRRDVVQRLSAVRTELLLLEEQLKAVVPPRPVRDEEDEDSAGDAVVVVRMFGDAGTIDLLRRARAGDDAAVAECARLYEQRAKLWSEFSPGERAEYEARLRRDAAEYAAEAAAEYAAEYAAAMDPETETDPVIREELLGCSGYAPNADGLCMCAACVARRAEQSGIGVAPPFAVPTDFEPSKLSFVRDREGQRRRRAENPHACPECGSVTAHVPGCSRAPTA